MIEFITYKEKKYPIRISYMAIMGLKEDTGKGMEDMGEGMDKATIESLAYHSLKSGAKAQGNEMPFKKEDIEDILEDCFMEFISLIPLFFPEDKLGKTVKKPRGPRTTKPKPKRK